MINPKVTIFSSRHLHLPKNTSCQAFSALDHWILFLKLFFADLLEATGDPEFKCFKALNGIFIDLEST